MRPVHPAKLKKQLPPPHLVPVMIYDGTTISDSKAILQYLDTHHPSSHPLYPNVVAGRGATTQWDSVDDLETYAHDILSQLYNYFGSVPHVSQREITGPFFMSLLPSPMRRLKFLQVIGSHAIRKAVLSRVTPLLGKDVVSSEENATKALMESLQKLEKAFVEDEQQFLFDTQEPTAADFAVFAALKRLLHPLPDVAGGIGAGFPNALQKAGGCRRLKKFFERMDAAYYQGKVDWTKAVL